MPLFSKVALYIWSAVPICFLFANIQNAPSIASNVAFTLTWIAGTLWITLSEKFFRGSKEQLNQYAEDMSQSKITQQIQVRASQSKAGYAHLLTKIPRHLANDLGLAVAVKWEHIFIRMFFLTFFIFGIAIYFST